MRYHYKKPGGWLWTPYDTDSLETDLRDGKIGADWRFRAEGDSTTLTPPDLIATDKASRARRREEANRAAKIEQSLRQLPSDSAAVWMGVLFTIGLLAADFVFYTVTRFNFTWIMVGGTGLWSAIDSTQIGLRHYKSRLRCGPVVLFVAIVLLWIVCFPYYLATRYKIKQAQAEEARRPVATPPPILSAAPPTDFEQHLRTLAKLRDEGVITEAEFEGKKRQILGI